MMVYGSNGSLKLDVIICFFYSMKAYIGAMNLEFV